MTLLYRVLYVVGFAALGFLCGAIVGEFLVFMFVGDGPFQQNTRDSLIGLSAMAGTVLGGILGGVYRRETPRPPWP